MRRYELIARRKIQLRGDVEVPIPAAGQVRVQVGACSICNRSDLVYYHYLGLREHCSHGCFGHEIAGTVDALGHGVTGFEVGDRVFIRTPLTSGFADFALAREVALGHLPDSIPFEHGAVLQLLPLVVHATRGIELGDRVLIIGQGPVGLMALQATALRGAAPIHAIDLDDWRLERSGRLGADETTVVENPEDCVAFGQTHAGKFDVAIDAVGTPDTARTCIAALRQGGLMVMLGTHHVDPIVSFDLIGWEYKGLRVHTAAEPTDRARTLAMQTAQQLVNNGRVSLEPLVTHRFPLSELHLAIEKLSANSVLFPADALDVPFTGPPPETLKVVVCP